jgi:hypothetical protein
MNSFFNSIKIPLDKKGIKSYFDKVFKEEKIRIKLEFIFNAKI